MSAAPESSRPLTRAASLLGAGAVLLTGALAMLHPLPPPQSEAAVALTTTACPLQPEGFLRGRLFGAVALVADWSGRDLACDGMRRPDDRGVRLYFAGDRPDGGRLALLIGIDGRQEELAGTERPANVTVMDERDRRFFSSAGPGRCWASIGSVTPLRRTRSRPDGSRVDGLVYCVGALPSVGGRESLTLGEIRFAGWVAADGG